MLGQQFGTILARTDPFDVAQGLERHIRSLSGEQVRHLILNARERMNDWYRAEFLPLADERDDERVKRGFAQTLKSNLRAIPLFGATFCHGVISQIPGDRAVGLGEESRPWGRMRPLAFLAIALALLLGGAAAEHVISAARATAETPVVTVTPAPAPQQTVVPVAAAPVQPQVRRGSRPVAQRITRQQARVTRAPAVAAAVPAPAQPYAAPPSATPPARAPRNAAASHTPAPGAGVKTVVAGRSPSTPAPAPSDVDVSDMPQAYTDATPLPRNETAPPAQVAAPVAVATPTPGQNRYWLHSTIKGTLKTIDHLNPFKHHGAPKPTPSPSGPEPL